MVEQTCNPSTWEAEAGESWVRGQLELHSEFQTSLGYRVKSCIKKKAFFNYSIQCRPTHSYSYKTLLFTSQNLSQSAIIWLVDLVSLEWRSTGVKTLSYCITGESQVLVKCLTQARHFINICWIMDEPLQTSFSVYDHYPIPKLALTCISLIFLLCDPKLEIYPTS
jgi:hypothetical protein